MAPTRGSGPGSSKKSTKPSNKTTTKPSTSSTSASSSKSRVSKTKPAGKRPPPKEQKSKSRSAPEMQKRKKKRDYTEKELQLPTMNMITPVGVQKPRGKKKGKVFVDDQESMMTILAIVNADKEGQIESKMMKSRHLEEIREARKNEAEARHEKKKLKLEATKDSLRRKKKGNKDVDKAADEKDSQPAGKKASKSKRVSFA